MKKAFTLTEILLAVAIVGVIAALVMPSLISKMDETILNNGHLRQTQALHDAIDTLTIAENKHSYFNTSMYSATQPTSYAETSGKFLKKYTRLSKYCGENNGDCFAKEYFKYENGKKETYTPEYKGACAVLKSGATICITPQIGGAPPKGLLDINGPKAPNVFGRDLREFVLEAQTERAVEKSTSAVLTHTAQPIETPDPTPDPTPEPTPPPPDPCTVEPYGLECCKTKSPGTYTSANKQCCNHLQIAHNYPQYCSQNISVILDCGYNWTGAMRNEACVRATCFFGVGSHCDYHGGMQNDRNKWDRECMDYTYRCRLVTDSDDDYELEITYRQQGHAGRNVGVVNTKNDNYLTVYADMVSGAYSFKLRNTSSGKLLDNQNNGNGNGNGNHDLWFGSNFSPAAGGGTCPIQYSYKGRNK